MSTFRKKRLRSAVVIVGALSMVAAACGSDSPKSEATTPASAAPTTAAATETTAAGGPGTTAGGSDTTAGGSDTTATGGSDTTAAGGEGGSAGCPAIDTSLDAEGGKGAGRFVSDLQCAKDKPLKAEGDPITIGYQNPEGDPNGSFPEGSLAAAAAAQYINEELGGLGADVQNGKPGRPVKFELCKMAISPDDSQRCANELIAKKPAMVISSFNFFGNQFPIYKAANIPVIVGSPITVGDYTSPDVYAIGAGGGCLGAHTALVWYATQELKGKKVGVPWADTPPGVVCYYDLEAKPLDVLSGKVSSTSKKAGSIPDLTYVGIPIKPATPDLTPQLTQLLDFKPDTIIFSAQASDCWNLVAGLGRLGWTPQQIPLVMSGSCVDFEAAKAAGDLAKGIYFVTGSGGLSADPASLDNPINQTESEAYQTKAVQYGLPKTEISKGFATNGFSVMMSLWERASEVAVSGEDVTGENISKAFAATDDDHAFGSTPLACAKAPAPYVAVCNSDAVIAQWDGTKLVPVTDRFSAIDLIAGTEIKPGP